MAAQPRPWFRLASISRPAPAPEPAPAPPPVQPRPPLVRPSTLFRPVAQPQPTQEPSPPPPPPPPPSPPPPAAAPAPPQAAATNGAASVPTSPVPRAASVPTSPIPRTASVPTSPIPRTASVPTSPIPRTASVPTSPMPKVVAGPTASVPDSPAKTSPPRTAIPTPTPSPPKPKAVAPSFSPAKTVMATSPTRVIQASSSPPRGAPVAMPTVTNVPSASTDRTFSPKQSPKPIKHVVDKTPPRESSRLLQANNPPPSPLTLPPSQIKSDEPKIPLEAEPKTVMQVQNEKPWTWHSIDKKKETAAKESELKEKEKFSHRKKTGSDSEEGSGVINITIAGENRGAFMEVMHSLKKHHGPHYLHKKGGTTTTDDSEKWHSYGNTSSSDQEGSSKQDKHRKGKSKNSLPMTAFMNSNVQGVNNSILFNSSCTHHDPGLHMALSRKTPGGGFHMNNKDHSHATDGAHH